MVVAAVLKIEPGLTNNVAPSPIFSVPLVTHKPKPVIFTVPLILTQPVRFKPAVPVGRSVVVPYVP